MTNNVSTLYYHCNILVPSIPNIGDAAILYTLWENLILAPDESKPNVDFIKVSQWQMLEKLGDISIKMIWQDVVTTLFGEKNYDLNRVVWDHANSNIFFEAISNYYYLE